MACTTFHCFLKLPVELQNAVWGRFCPEIDHTTREGNGIWKVYVRAPSDSSPDCPVIYPTTVVPPTWRRTLRTLQRISCATHSLVARRFPHLGHYGPRQQPFRFDAADDIFMFFNAVNDDGAVTDHLFDSIPQISMLAAPIRNVAVAPCLHEMCRWTDARPSEVRQLRQALTELRVVYTCLEIDSCLQGELELCIPGRTYTDHWSYLSNPEDFPIFCFPKNTKTGYGRSVLHSLDDCDEQDSLQYHDMVRFPGPSTESQIWHVRRQLEDGRAQERLEEASLKLDMSKSAVKLAEAVVQSTSLPLRFGRRMTNVSGLSTLRNMAQAVTPQAGS